MSVFISFPSPYSLLKRGEIYVSEAQRGVASKIIILIPAFRFFLKLLPFSKEAVSKKYNNSKLLSTQAVKFALM